MHGSSSKTNSALIAPRPALQRFLSWLAATPLAVGICIAAAPSAKAISFTSESPATNPFFYNPPSKSWVLVSEDSLTLASVTLDPNDGTTIFFESSGVNTDTFTSGKTDKPYTILFDYEFNPDPDPFENEAIAYYQICTSSDCTGSAELELGPGGTFSITPFSLTTNQYLRFGINNNNSGGNLTISNFSATVPVPSPLPFAGLGLAALGIYRARCRRKSTAMPK